MHQAARKPQNMMGDMSEDGPPSNKRAKIGPGGMTPTDNGEFNLSALDDLPPSVFGANGGNAMSQSGGSIPEQHQNISSLLLRSPQQKDILGHQGPMNSSMMNNYSGPGPGQPPCSQSYHGHMMNGPVSSYNTINSSGYNTSSTGSYVSSCYSGGQQNANPMYSSNMPTTYSATSSMSHMSGNANSIQAGGGVPHHMQSQSGMGGMMNGPVSNSSVMQQQQSLSSAPGGMNTRPAPAQGMTNGPSSLPGSGPMPVNGPMPTNGPLSSNGPLPPGSGGNGPPGQGTPGPVADPEKRKLIQQQLVLLLHAHKCQRRERSNGELGGEKPCGLPHCKTMKGVLQHMTECGDGKQCQVPHCASSRQIIAHWRNCTRNDCPVCLPLKSASDRKNTQNVLSSLVASSAPQPNASMNGIEVNRPLGPGGGMPGPGMPGPGMPGPGGMSGPGGGMPASGPVQSGPSGPMPPPGWPPSNPPGPQPGMAPGGVPPGGQPRGANQTISAPEMKRAYDALGLQYPGTGQSQHPSGLVNQPGGLRNAPIAGPGAMMSNSNQPVKEWHKNVAIDLRNHLVHKLVQAIFPSPDPHVLNDPRMTNLIQYARKVEMDMYKTANSREEYYHMLAEKIYKIQKELEEKRRARQLSSASNAGPPGAPPVAPPGSHGPGGMGNMASGGPPSNQPHTPGGSSQPTGTAPGSQQSSMYGTAPPSVGSSQGLNGPPSVGRGILSPGVPPTSGVSVTTALQESSKEFQEALRKHGQIQDPKTELIVKTEPKTEPSQDSGFVAASTDSVKSEHIEFKEEPRTPAAPQTPKPDVKPDIKPATPSRPPVQKKVFQADELRQALMPTLEKLFKLDESLPFRQAVDAIGLNIPDYYDIIKTPMDLGTIKNKLDTGAYTNPWEYCDDVWLMFDNAWLYNKKNSRVYKWCSKLHEVFEGEINTVMQKLGYCCGMKYVFHPQNLCCYGKQLCTITRDQVYYSYENRYVFCEKCFDEITAENVDVTDEMTGNPLSIPRDQFIKTKNDVLEMEKFCYCTDCGRKMHNICVQHMDEIWPQGFTCDACLKAKGAKRKDNRFTARRLPTCKLGSYLELRVNNYLRKKNVGAGDVSIRVLASSEKETEIKPGMKERFPNLPTTYPYRCKAMFAFEEIDGREVCFFGMHVQEYDSNGVQPNTGRVYISYLDSVHFFQPREYRTAVYHEILIGYLDYCKSLGYNWGHIWACPPSEGDDYIFHCHPSEQKIPKPKRLQEWYKRMLDKAIIEGVIIEYKDIYKDAIEKNLSCATEVPYFEGDFWPNVLEESIKELEQEEEEKRKREALVQDEEPDCMADGDENGVDPNNSGKKQGKKTTKKKGNKKASTRKSNAKKSSKDGSCDLTTKVISTMEKYRDVFFVIKLQPHALAYQKPIIDPDPLISCDLMDGRDAFLTMAREKHWEFSTLRRTTYSSMAMLHEIHTSSRDAFVYTCNACKGQVETRYHCTVCDDYDMCIPCYKKDGHQHRMERLGLEVLSDDAHSDASGQQTPAEQRRLNMQRCIQSLEHACQCRDANCRLPACQKMKRVVNHTRTCKRKTNGGCPLCKPMIALCCYHAKHCAESKCPVPFCQNIKQKLKQQKLAARMQQARLLQRRMAQMSGPTSSSSSTPPSSSSANANKLQHSNSQSSIGGSQSVASPYTGSGKPVPSNAPPAAVHAAQSALHAAIKQTQQTPGQPPMQQQQQHPQQTSLAGPMPPQSQPQQQHMGQLSRQPSNQQIMHPGMAGMQPNGAPGQPVSQMYGPPSQQHRPMGPNQMGMNPSSNMMMQPNQPGGPPPDHWGGQSQGGGPPPPMYSGPSGPSGGHPQQICGTHPGMAGSMNQMGPRGSPMSGPGGLPHSASNIRPAIQQLQQVLRGPHNQEQVNELQNILRTNPNLMAAFIKQKREQQQMSQRGMAPNQGPRMPGPPGPPQGHPGMNHQQMSQHQMRSMPGPQHQDGWAVPRGRGPPMQHGGMYQPGMPPSSSYQPQPPQQMSQRGMPPQMGHYGMTGGQGRYPGEGGPGMQQGGMQQGGMQPGGMQPGDGMMGGMQQNIRPGGMMPNNLLQQVRSPPTSLPQHTRSPQPMPSPRQQASASPAMMGDGSMGGMMQGGIPGRPPSAPMQQNFPPSEYEQQQQQQQFQENQNLTPQEELSKFVDSL